MFPTIRGARADVGAHFPPTRYHAAIEGYAAEVALLVGTAIFNSQDSALRPTITLSIATGPSAHGPSSEPERSDFVLRAHSADLTCT
jgi:hypothetical protein